MSETDRERWNQRYLEGFYADRPYPVAFLEANIETFTPGRALDIACGSGRNTRFLAQHGFSVVGIDISDYALALAQKHPSDTELNIEYIQHDLDQGLPELGQFDLITIIRYANRPLLANIDRYLRPNGYVLIELHLRYDCDDRPLAGPTEQKYRMQRHEVQSLLKDVQIEFGFEGLIKDPDGRDAAVSQWIAQKIPKL